MNETKTEVFKGNLGFYPCSFETMKKLKALNQYAHWMEGRQTQIARKMNKLPHNRVNKVPELDKEGRFMGYKVTPWVQPEVIDYPSGLWENARRARFPIEKQEDVVPLGWSEERIDELLTKYREAFGK